MYRNKTLFPAINLFCFLLIIQQVSDNVISSCEYKCLISEMQYSWIQKLMLSASNSFQLVYTGQNKFWLLSDYELLNAENFELDKFLLAFWWLAFYIFN
jgi:hypothetical protein